MSRVEFTKTRPREGDSRTEYGEKKVKVTVSLTRTGIEGLDRIAEKLGLNRSSLLEEIGRKEEEVIKLLIAD